MRACHFCMARLTAVKKIGYAQLTMEFVCCLSFYVDLTRSWNDE